MLRKAGIEVGGTRPYDIAVHDSRLYRRALLHGSRGLGEAYMDGWWDCEALDELFYRIRAQRKESKDPRRMALWFTSKVSNLQSIELSREVAERHYDRGNDLFIAMLDRRLTYTCGYWKEAANLNEAQENKLKLVCDKLALRAGQRVLDIGCGFGSFAKYAAEQYGVSVVGVTISKEQVVLGRKLCAGLPVELCLLDYREVREKYPEPFDHIVSLGMFEHVGRKNHALFMGEVATLLKDEGLFFLQSIGGSGRTAFHNRGLAQFRRRLRHDAHGVAPKFRRSMGETPEFLRRTVQTDVVLLSPLLRRLVSRSPEPALADRVLKTRCSRRVSINPLGARKKESPVVARRSIPRATTSFFKHFFPFKNYFFSFKYFFF